MPGLVTDKPVAVIPQIDISLGIPFTYFEIRVRCALKRARLH
jgi:hypothetical protein